MQQIWEILGLGVLLPRRQRIAQGPHSHLREAEHWVVPQDAQTQIQDKRDYKLSKVDLGQQAATIKSRVTQYRALDLLWFYFHPRLRALYPSERQAKLCSFGYSSDIFQANKGWSFLDSIRLL
jgi:hypothetical protein